MKLKLFVSLFLMSCCLGAIAKAPKYIFYFINTSKSVFVFETIHNFFFISSIKSV